MPVVRPHVDAGLTVAPCSSKAARFAITHWHYSRRMPMPPLVPYGAWERGEFIGAVVYGRGAAPQLGRRFALRNTQLCELVRVAMRAHETPVSQIVSETVRQLRASNPGLRVIVSFADPAHDHHGGIYQAMNWLYLGTTTPGPAYRDARGRIYHSRVVTGSGWVTQFGKMTRVPRPEDLERVTLPAKHRYVLPLDRAMRRQLSPLALPYPRRAE